MYGVGVSKISILVGLSQRVVSAQDGTRGGTGSGQRSFSE
jgi:hypothetical protein